MSAVSDQNSTQKHTIKRWAHDRQNPYTQIHNELIRDETVAPEARLLLIYLLANKDGWEIRVTQLLNHFKPFWGRDKVYKVINQCIEAGYMQKDILREKGRHIGVNYYVAEYPAFKELLPLPENPHTSLSNEANTYYNKDQDIKKKQDIKESSSKPSSTQPPKKPEIVEPLIDDACGADDLDNSFSSPSQETTASSDIVVVGTNGKERRVTESELYLFFTRHPEFTTEEIQAAVAKFRTLPNPINNVLGYILEICKSTKKEQLRPVLKNKKTKTPPKDYTNLYPEPVPHKNLVNMGDLMKMTPEEREQLKKNLKK